VQCRVIDAAQWFFSNHCVSFTFWVLRYFVALNCLVFAATCGA
jgi:hypothetical protein